MKFVEDDHDLGHDNPDVEHHNSYAMLYGIKGKDGKGYPNPEIIQGIIDYLK